MKRFCAAKSCVTSAVMNTYETTECVTCLTPYCSIACRQCDKDYHNQFICINNDEDSRLSLLRELRMPGPDYMPRYNGKPIIPLPGPITVKLDTHPIPRNLRSTVDKDDVDAQAAFKCIPRMKDEDVKYIHYLVNYNDIVPLFHALASEQRTELIVLFQNQITERVQESMDKFVTLLSNIMIKKCKEPKLDINKMNINRLDDNNMTTMYDILSKDLFNKNGNRMVSLYAGQIILSIVKNTQRNVTIVTDSGTNSYPSDFDNLDEILETQTPIKKKEIFKVHHHKELEDGNKTEKQRLDHDLDCIDDFFVVIPQSPFIQHLSIKI